MTRSVNRWLVALAAVVAASPAAGQGDPSGHWRTWTTEHFRVHASAELGVYARRLAAEAERAYALLAREFPRPGGRIDIALHDNVDFAAGFARVSPTNRMVLFLSAPAGDAELGFYDEWLRILVSHELFHVFHLDRAEGVWKGLRAVFGRAPALFPNAYQPSWVLEGLAVHYESRLSTAGRGRGAYHRQLLAAAARGPEWPASGDATLVNPRWPGAVRPYAWGGVFFGAQAAAHGDSLAPRFVEKTSRRIWPFAVSTPLIRAGGTGVDEMWGAMRSSADPAGSVPYGEVLVRGLRQPPEPSISADGRLAYVHAEGRSPPYLSLLDWWTGQELGRQRLNARARLGWVGQDLLVSQLDLTSPIEIRSDLYRWSMNGPWERLSRGARVAAPFRLPSGGIGVLSMTGGANRAVIWSDGPYALDSPPAEDWNGVSSSVDGVMAGARLRDGGWWITVWPHDDPGAAVDVAGGVGLVEAPSWSPSGDLLVFNWEREGMPQIYGWHRVTGAVLQLTAEPTGARSPAAGPDGSLVYVTPLEDGYAVLRIPIEPLIAVDVPEGRVSDEFDSAASVTALEGPFNPWPTLRPRHWLPALRRAGTVGTYVGGETRADDAIGRTAYVARALYAPDAARWDLSFSAVHTRWREAAVDVRADYWWEHAGRGIVVETGDTVPLARRTRMVSAGFSVVPWRRWRTFTSVRLGSDLEWELIRVDGDLFGGTVVRSRKVASGVLGLSGGHLSSGPLAISPENGVTATASYRRRTEIADDGRGHEWRGAVSGYVALPLPGFARWVLAANVRVGHASGTLAPQFALGGESGGSSTVLPGVALSTPRRAFPLRGYPVNVERFTRVAVSTVELRVPLALVGRGLGGLPMGADRISATVFAEGGGGWIGADPGGSFLSRALRYRAVGLEGVFDMASSYDYPVRVRLGGAVPLTSGLGAARGAPRAWVALGSAF